MLALAAVEQALDRAGISYEVAWSPVFRPGALRLEDAPPGRYTHLVFVCGPLHGAPVAGLHTRFAALRRIAVGVTVIDRSDPACTGFDLVLARDGDQVPARLDLSAAVLPAFPPASSTISVIGGPGTPPTSKAWRGSRPAWGEYAVEIRMEYVGDPPWLDLDNLAKAILDAIKGYAFHDDAQVARLLVERHAGERERITVTVRALQAPARTGGA